jgi:hypothetical protein
MNLYAVGFRLCAHWWKVALESSVGTWRHIIASELFVQVAGYIQAHWTHTVCNPVAVWQLACWDCGFESQPRTWISVSWESYHVWCVRVWSGNLKNEGALAQVGLLGHRGEKVESLRVWKISVCRILHSLHPVQEVRRNTHCSSGHCSLAL